MLWLKAASSNNNPRYIASFYMDCVKEIGGYYIGNCSNLCKCLVFLIGCPCLLRTDAGTGNSLLAMIQPMLRHEHTDDLSKDKSHIYGRSTSNQVSLNEVQNVNNYI